MDSYIDHGVMNSSVLYLLFLSLCRLARGTQSLRKSARSKHSTVDVAHVKENLDAKFETVASESVDSTPKIIKPEKLIFGNAPDSGKSIHEEMTGELHELVLRVAVYMTLVGVALIMCMGIPKSPSAGAGSNRIEVSEFPLHLVAGSICLFYGRQLSKLLGHWGNLGRYLVPLVNGSYKVAYDVSGRVSYFLSGLALVSCTIAMLSYLCNYDQQIAWLGAIIAHFVLFGIAWDGTANKTCTDTIEPLNQWLDSLALPKSIEKLLCPPLAKTITILYRITTALGVISLYYACHVFLGIVISHYFFPAAKLHLPHPPQNETVLSLFSTISPLVIVVASGLPFIKDHLAQFLKPLTDKIFGDFFCIYGWPTAVILLLATSSHTKAYLYLALTVFITALLSFAVDYLYIHINNIIHRHHPKLSWKTVPERNRAADFPTSTKTEITHYPVQTTKGTDVKVFAKLIPLSEDQLTDGPTLQSLIREVLAYHRFSTENEHPTFYGGDLLPAPDGRAKYLRLLFHYYPETLQRYIGDNKVCKINAHQLIKLAYQIALSITKLHSQGVSHGDIATHNIGMNETNDAILIDFGKSQPLTPSSKRKDIEKYRIVMADLSSKCLDKKEKKDKRIVELNSILQNDKDDSLLEKILHFRSFVVPTA